MTAKWNERKLLETGRAFNQPAVLLALVEIDAFTALAREPMSAADLASRLSLDPRATAIVLDAAAAMGLLEKQDGAYRPTPDGAPWLDSRRTDGAFWTLRHMARLQRNWCRLADAMRGGGPVTAGVREAEPVEREAFIRAMHRIALPQADELAAAIDPGTARHLLDVGGGPGTYTLALLKIAPALHATIFDLPHAIEIARGYVAEASLLDRVTFVTGDFTTDKLPEGHDLALVSAIIHQNSRLENVDLYRKVHAALVRGGRIVIRDHVMDATRTEPFEGALFAVNMLLHTEGGGTFTFDEIKEDLERAGFAEVAYRRPSGPRMDGIVDAFRRD